MLPPLVLGLAILLLLFSIGTITWLYLRLVRFVAFAERKGSYDPSSIQAQILGTETDTNVKCACGRDDLCENPILRREEASGGLLSTPPTSMTAQTDVGLLLRITRPESEHSKSSMSLEGEDSAYSSFFDDGAKLRFSFSKESIDWDESSPNETAAAADATATVKTRSDLTIHVGEYLGGEFALAEGGLPQAFQRPRETNLEKETARVSRSYDTDRDSENRDTIENSRADWVRGTERVSENGDPQSVALEEARTTSSLCTSQRNLNAANSEAGLLESLEENETGGNLPIRKLHDETYRQYIESIKLKNQARLFFGPWHIKQEETSQPVTKSGSVW